MSSAGKGAEEIRTVLAESRRLFGAVGLFSAFVNLLMLTGILGDSPVAAWTPGGPAR